MVSVACNVIFDFSDFDLLAKLAISIARKMNALIFLVPEDIVDVRPRLVRLFEVLLSPYANQYLTDHDVCRELDGDPVIEFDSMVDELFLCCTWYRKWKLFACEVGSWLMLVTLIYGR